MPRLSPNHPFAQQRAQATLAVSSFTCAMAPTFTWLLLGRALQGLGASGLGVALASASVGEGEWLVLGEKN